MPSAHSKGHVSVHVSCWWCGERLLWAMNPINSITLSLQKGLRHTRSLTCFLEAWSSFRLGNIKRKWAVVFSFQTGCSCLEAPRLHSCVSRAREHIYIFWWRCTWSEERHFGQGRHMGLSQENKGEFLVLVLPDSLRVEHLCLLRSLIPSSSD